MDGVETSAKLRKNPETSHIPIIALCTDLPENGEFDDYLMKPINIAQLLCKISPFIQKEDSGNSDLISTNRKFSMNKDTIPLEVLADIRDQLNPLLKKLETSIIISSVKNLAELLISLGEQYQSEVLIVKGKELMSYAECYDIVNIKLKLRHIEKILLEDNSDGK